MSWLDRLGKRFGPEWHSVETTWPHGEKSKEYVDGRDHAEFFARDDLSDSDFSYEIHREEGPSSNPDENQPQTWFGRWQAGRAADSNWEPPSYDQEEQEREERAEAMDMAREATGYYENGHSDADEARQQAIKNRWDSEGFDESIDYRAEYEAEQENLDRHKHVEADNVDDRA